MVFDDQARLKEATQAIMRSTWRAKKAVESSTKNYEERIDKLKISDKAKETLKELISEENYQETVATARETGAHDSEIKTRKEIFEGLIALGPAMLEEISTFGRPRVYIVSKNTLDAKFAQMNSNRHYPGQGKVFSSDENDSPFKNVPNPKKTTIIVTDTDPSMQQFPQNILEKKWGERIEWIKKEYEDKVEAARAKGDMKFNLRLINVHEYMVIMQGSLCIYEKTKNEADIMDVETVTALDETDLLNSRVVAFGCFREIVCELTFSFYYRDDTRHYLRMRPVVQVLEY